MLYVNKVKAMNVMVSITNLDNSNGENVKGYCMIKIGNSAFIRGFFSNPLKSLVRLWYYKALLRNNILLVLDCGPTYW